MPNLRQILPATVQLFLVLFTVFVYGLGESPWICWMGNRLDGLGNLFVRLYRDSWVAAGVALYRFIC